MAKFTDKEKEEFARLAGCFYATIYQMSNLFDKVQLGMKYKFSLFLNFGKKLFSEMAKNTSPQEGEQFEAYALYAQEVLIEAMKAKDKSKFLEMVKSFNAPSEKINAEEEKTV